jgi:hypothetical protein
MVMITTNPTANLCLLQYERRPNKVGQKYASNEVQERNARCWSVLSITTLYIAALCVLLFHLTV